MIALDMNGCSLGKKKKNCYVALSRPTVKCEKTGSGFFFFFFFMSDLGEEFAKICIQWLKKSTCMTCIWVRILNDVQLGPDMG